MTPTLHQSGESSRIGRVSLCGDGMTRSLLYEAAQVLLTRVTKWSWLKAWAMEVAKRRGQRRVQRDKLDESRAATWMRTFRGGRSGGRA